MGDFHENVLFDDPDRGLAGDPDHGALPELCSGTKPTWPLVSLVIGDAVSAATVVVAVVVAVAEAGVVVEAGPAIKAFGLSVGDLSMHLSNATAWLVSRSLDRGQQVLAAEPGDTVAVKGKEKAAGTPAGWPLEWAWV